LWKALQEAPAEGVTIAVLMAVTGMGRSWVYYRLSEHAAAGRAAQVTRGCWRATPEKS
jgi:S-DNA-T family DNA segregation ATPase FtsK/SpoIIIE